MTNECGTELRAYDAITENRFKENSIGLLLFLPIFFNKYVQYKMAKFFYKIENFIGTVNKLSFTI